MKLKVCGMKYDKNIKAIADLQPDYMGFIFYAKSPRNFEGSIPDISKQIKKTGVFVNKDIEEVLRLVDKHSLNALQLHGNESVDYIEQIKKEITDIEIIKVFGIKDEFDFTTLQPYESIVNYFLFDTKGKYKGGNGVTFDWTVLENYSSEVPFFLSGGIGLDTMEALTDFMQSPIAKKCATIDVNSRFEVEPGLKSVADVKIFKEKLERIKTI